MLDGQEIFLMNTFPLTVVPLAVGDSFTSTRQPSALTPEAKQFVSEVYRTQTVMPRQVNRHITVVRANLFLFKDSVPPHTGVIVASAFACRNRSDNGDVK